MSKSRLLTLRDCIRWAASHFHAAGLFFGHGTDNAWDKARHLVLGSPHLPWEIPDSYLDCRLEDDEHAGLMEVLRWHIEEQIPAVYLLDEAWFCGVSFSVGERVLVPRSPIAELIEQHFAPWLPAKPARILDLYTGSGCVDIACAYAFEQAKVVPADLSSDALGVANVDIERHDLGEQVYTVQDGGFAGLPGQCFDPVMSNPPYVDAEGFADIPTEFHHEPELDLACGNDSLDLVRRMFAEAVGHLSKKGLLIAEVGNSEIHVQALYPEVDFAWLEFRYGGHEVFMLSAARCREHRELFRSRSER